MYEIHEIYIFVQNFPLYSVRMCVSWRCVQCSVISYKLYNNKEYDSNDGVFPSYIWPDGPIRLPK